MRVQPLFPSPPLLTSVRSSNGSRQNACSAAINPAPPAPRMRMSVENRSLMTSASGRQNSKLQKPNTKEIPNTKHQTPVSEPQREFEKIGRASCRERVE